jgi:hypothetical protein
MIAGICGDEYSNKNKIAVFDLDDCLIHEGFTEPKAVDAAEIVLKYLQDKNINSVLATHNIDGEYIISRLGWTDKNILNRYYVIMIIPIKYHISEKSVSILMLNVKILYFLMISMKIFRQ